MGGLQGWPGEFDGESSSPALPRWQQSYPHPAEVAVEIWRVAEGATGEVVRRIQPTIVSEERRRAVVEYVQRLMRGYLGTEVFPFGSVPLKTYLPDGDIDLTALGFPNAEDALAIDVRTVLEIEEQNKDAEFEVRDVQYIHAEVKLVKCLVQNIVVDISFNQIGGLCTLCFLEQVDRLIGKDNLFKRSIILIKAWCYYESRILGAHHGLISTYALETLVLYIFHLFHSSLDGPLAVLYRFLDYYSKFDWDNYCISLHGPVAINTLPELVAQPPENEGDDLLLSSEFLKNCVDMFAVPSRGAENNSRVFPQKHLNIVDPLKENNNLGRSVSKGNFYRIRSAFSFGARKLGRILLLPSGSIAEEINMFFANTLDRHGDGERPDVQDSFIRCPENTEPVHNRESTVEKGKEDKLVSRSPATVGHGGLCEEVNKIKISGSDKELDIGVQSVVPPSNHHLDEKLLHKCTDMEIDSPKEADVVSGKRLAGDAQDLASNQAAVSRNCEPLSSNNEAGGTPPSKAYHAPHFSYHPDNGRGIQKLDHTVNSSIPIPLRDDRQLVQIDPHEYESSSSSSSWCSSNLVLPASTGSKDRSLHSSWTVYLSENSQVEDSSFSKMKDDGTNGSLEYVNLLDLTGDYDTHFKNLLHVQWCQDYMLGGLILPNTVSSPSQFRNKHSWDVFHRSNMFVPMNANGVVSGPPFSPSGIYPMHPPYLSGAYPTEDMPKPRGTGTYFPNTSYRTYKDRRPPWRGRPLVPTNQMPRPRHNGRPGTPQDMIGRHETYRQPQSPSYNGNGRGKPPLLEMPQSSHSSIKETPHANGCINSHEGKLEFGSFSSAPYSSSSSELGKKLEPVSPHRQGWGQVVSASTGQKQETSSSSERMKQAYQLKDEDDFPPLNG